MSGYDPDERIHPPAPSFLSRPPTRAERRRLRRRLAAMPPPPDLVFWPQSVAIDGPWRAGAGVTAASGFRPAHWGCHGITGATDRPTAAAGPNAVAPPARTGYVRPAPAGHPAPIARHAASMTAARSAPLRRRAMSGRLRPLHRRRRPVLRHQ